MTMGVRSMGPSRYPVSGKARSFWLRARPIERRCFRIGVVLVVVGLAHLGVLIVTGSSWQGPLSWRKPATFGLSFGMTLLTITWVTSYLPLSTRARRWWLGLFATACSLEVGLIALQAWRRVPSHFNMETTFDAVIARTLAIGGGTIIVVIAALTVVAFRDNPEVGASLRLAIRAGFLALLFALAIGAMMIAEGMIRVFAGDQQGAYAVAGALKPAHAVTMHGILILPALAWLLSLTDWDEAQRVCLVWFAIVGYALLAGMVVAVSFAGITPDHAPVVARTLAVLGTGVLSGVGVVAVVALRRPTIRWGESGK